MNDDYDHVKDFQQARDFLRYYHEQDKKSKSGWEPLLSVMMYLVMGAMIVMSWVLILAVVYGIWVVIR